MGLVVDSYRFATAAGGSITFPITGVAEGYTATRSPAFTLGTSPVEDDVIVAFIVANIAGTMTDVTDWTNVGGANFEIQPGDSTLAGVMVYHRVSAAEDAADTVTWTLTDLWDATKTGNIAVAVLRGVATTGELVGFASTSDAAVTTPWVIADVTPTATCQIMAGVGGDGAETQTTPGSHTLQSFRTAGGSTYLYSDDTLGANGVATGTTDVTPSGSNEYVSIVACFAPA